MTEILNNPTINELKTVYSFNTNFNADSVEWCPHSPYQNFFVCANYQLLESEEQGKVSKRYGSILLFKIGKLNGLELCHSLNTSGILDQKWCHKEIGGCSILGVVNAQKTVEIYKFNTAKLKLELVTCSEIKWDSDGLMLSLDWNTGRNILQDPCIICSDSKGAWYQFLYSNDKLLLVNSSNAHKHEAWIAAYYYWDPAVFFTGGDDNILCMYDLKTGKCPILKTDVHEAGVTSIHSNAEREHCIVSGSYDEHLRLWDNRTMKYPLTSTKMPGPVWRLKWDPFSYKYLLAACMSNGAHIVKVGDCDKLEVVASYNKHKSMVYGADWCYLNYYDGHSILQHKSDKIIGTCSFYDNLICVSNFSMLNDDN